MTYSSCLQTYRKEIYKGLKGKICIICCFCRKRNKKAKIKTRTKPPDLDEALKLWVETAGEV
jgi:hypothetical protein